MGSSGRLAVYGNTLFGHEPSSLCPRDSHLIGEEPIETFSILTEN
jgi:hypothetical protein